MSIQKHRIGLGPVWAAILMGIVIPGSVRAELLYVQDDQNRLGTVDLNTGDVSVIGTMGLDPNIEPVTDIAFDPSGRLFGVTFNLSQAGQSYLYRIDHETAAITPVGSLGQGVIGQNALTFYSKGYLYSAGAVNGNLYQLNSLTGTATLLGDTGFTSGGDLAFVGSQLYLSSKTFFPNTPDKLVRMNGLTTASVDPGTSIGEFGFANVFGMATGSGDTLYGVAGTQIFTINPITGAGTLLFDYAGHGLGPAQGTAFFGESGAPNSVPEPSSVVLLSLGAAGVGVFGTRRRRRSSKD